MASQRRRLTISSEAPPLGAVRWWTNLDDLLSAEHDADTPEAKIAAWSSLAKYHADKAADYALCAERERDAAARGWRGPSRAIPMEGDNG